MIFGIHRHAPLFGTSSTILRTVVLVQIKIRPKLSTYVKGEVMALRIGRCLLPVLLKKAKLSQLEFALRVGMSESTISHYTHNTRRMSLLNAKLIARELGVHIDDLYEWQED